jgi:hypothetical protein
MNIKMGSASHMRRLKTFGILLVAAGALIIFMSTVLPLVKTPQTLQKKGPSVKLDETINYWIDTWILPPIDKGTSLTVDLVSESPGGVSITIFPSKNGEIIAGSNPILTSSFTPIQQSLHTTKKASMTSEYTVSIICIMNNFTLTISSNWSPFYVLRTYLYLGLGSLPAGLLIIYYSKIKESKEKILLEAQSNSASTNIV